MMNPIVLMVVAVVAAVVAIGWFIDKMGWLDAILKTVGEVIGWLGEKFKLLVKMLPDVLIPDGWKDSADEAGDEVDKLNAKLSKTKR